MIIFSPGKDELYKFEANLRVTEFEYPIYIDYEYDFGEINPQINSLKHQNVFLVDFNGKIILVGDPYYNTQMLNLYKKTMTDLIKQ